MANGTPAWTDGVAKAAEAYFGTLGSKDACVEAWRPWEELQNAVAKFLDERALKALESTAVYTSLVALFEDRPRMRARFKGLLCFQDGDRLKQALLRLVTTREAGDEGRRIAAMDLGGIGRATASELLCLWRPYRFLPQNTVTCAAVAKVTEVYKKRDIEEFPYDIFMDLAGSLEGAFRAAAERAFPELGEVLKARRYLYFYAFLSEK
jgi:hypothetical protein